MKPSFNQAVPAEFQESHRRQRVAPEQRVKNAYARMTTAAQRKAEEWQMRLDCAQVAETAVAAHVAKLTQDF